MAGRDLPGHRGTGRRGGRGDPLVRRGRRGGRPAPGAGLRPEGQPATMEVPDPHIRVNQISAISNEGKVHFMTYTGNMNAALFLVFLGRLLRRRRGRCS